MRLSTICLLSLLVLIMGCSKEIIKSQKNTDSSKVLSASISTDIVVTSATGSSTSSPFSASNAIDNYDSTFWSSAVHSTADNTESIDYHFSGFNNVNYIRLMPRYSGSSALCFPVDFKIYYSTGSTWVLITSFTGFPTPTGLGVTIPFNNVVNTDGILVTATKLGYDGTNYYFQIADVDAGYDVGFTHFQLTGNNGNYQQNAISNVGSDSFNPSKLLNWTPDDRDPIISATTGGNSNIYAPSVVYNNGSWNTYFGGWDGTSDGHDRVSISVSSDNFLTFGSHVLMVDNGVFQHLNNETVIKKPDGTWRMYYTTLAYGGLNKPGYTTSTDGASWSPSTGSTSYLLNMAGYTNYSNADVNGSNVIYFDGTNYHLYFDDFNSSANGHTFNVHHATSSDGVNFTYTGDALNETQIAQDVKHFSYSGTNYYLMGMQLNSNYVRYSLSTSLTSFPASQLLFNNLNTFDQYITSMGFVVNANRLLGVFYGAGSVNTLDHNSIHARWLTKKIIFISDRTQARWGDVEKAHGPDKILLYMNTNIETGHFYIYDTDGTTLLYESPQVTMKSGDTWSYVP